jgi:hypothetical protein
MSSWLLRSAAAGAGLVFLVFALVAYRVSERGLYELGESDRAFDAGQLELAVEHARRAAAAYVPGAPHMHLGFERLRAVARGAERTRDLALARAAWRAVRAAAVESQHLWQPHAAELAAADLELARLWGGPARSSPSAAPAPALRALSLICGAVLGLGGLLAACGQAAYDEASSNRRRRRAAIVSCVVGAALWSGALLVPRLPRVDGNFAAPDGARATK